MHRDTRAFIVALGAYAAFYVAFFLKSLLTGNLIAPSDSMDFGVAAYLSSPALWTQGMYSGYPIAADPQSLTWYPILYLFRALRLDWNGFLISAYVIASATSFLLVRRLTGSALAGTFSGFVYGFSAVMLGHIGHFNQIHAAAWVPLALYGFQVIRDGAGRQGGLVAAVAMAMMWLAGHPQVPVYTAYLAGALVLGGLLLDRPSKQEVIARLGWSAFGVVVGLAIAAVAILPMVELGELSRRAESNWELYTSKALPPWQLLGIALPFAFGGMWSNGEMPVPYFGLGGPAENTGYVGLLPLVLALAAPFVLQTHRREAILWMAVTIIAVLLCLGAATPIGRMFFYAPGYASFRVPARHLFVVAICLAGLSGLAFAELTRKREGWGRLALSIGAVMALVGLLFVTFMQFTPQVRELVGDDGVYRTWVVQWPVVLGGLLLSCAFLGSALGARPAALVGCALLLIGLQVLDLTTVHYRMPGQRLEYADVERREASVRPRIAALRDELRRSGQRALAPDGSRNPFLLPNLTRPWGVLSATGTGSLGIERYLDVMGMGGPGDVYPETLSVAHRGVDLLSVGYALVPSNAPVAQDMQQQLGRWSAVEDLQYYDHDPDTRYTLFRNERAQPRAWCVPGVVHATPDQILAAIRIGHLPNGQGAYDPAQVALAEPDVLRDWSAAGTGPAAEVVVEVEPEPRYLIRTDAPCVLVMSEVFYPWWRASIDDREAEIVRVNHTLMGLAVPPGQHVVRLRLAATSVWLGGGLTTLGLLACGFVLLAGRRRAAVRT